MDDFMLHKGQSFATDKVRFEFQTDGNLVFYVKSNEGGENELFSTKTDKSWGIEYFKFQKDGL